MNEDRKLNDLKKDYEKLKERYSLPEFDELNKDFQIEKAVEVDTDYLIREIRKLIGDKFFNYLRFVESILNPSNAPMFVFSITKIITENEREKLRETYKKLAKNEVFLVEVDVDFNEEKEAEFIKKSYKTWKEIKKDLSDVLEIIKKNWDNKVEGKNKGYFG